MAALQQRSRPQIVHPPSPRQQVARPIEDDTVDPNEQLDLGVSIPRHDGRGIFPGSEEDDDLLRYSTDSHQAGSDGYYDFVRGSEVLDDEYERIHGDADDDFSDTRLTLSSLTTDRDALDSPALLSGSPFPSPHPSGNGSLASRRLSNQSQSLSQSSSASARHSGSETGAASRIFSGSPASRRRIRSSAAEASHYSPPPSVGARAGYGSAAGDHEETLRSGTTLTSAALSLQHGHQRLTRRRRQRPRAQCDVQDAEQAEFEHQLSLTPFATSAGIVAYSSAAPEDVGETNQRVRRRKRRSIRGLEAGSDGDDDAESSRSSKRSNRGVSMPAIARGPLVDRQEASATRQVEGGNAHGKGMVFINRMIKGVLRVDQETLDLVHESPSRTDTAAPGLPTPATTPGPDDVFTSSRASRKDDWREASDKATRQKLRAFVRRTERELDLGHGWAAAYGVGEPDAGMEMFMDVDQSEDEGEATETESTGRVRNFGRSSTIATTTSQQPAASTLPSPPPTPDASSALLERIQRGLTRSMSYSSVPSSLLTSGPLYESALSRLEKTAGTVSAITSSVSRGHLRGGSDSAFLNRLFTRDELAGGAQQKQGSTTDLAATTTSDTNTIRDASQPTPIIGGSVTFEEAWPYSAGPYSASFPDRLPSALPHDSELLTDESHYWTRQASAAERPQPRQASHDRPYSHDPAHGNFEHPMWHARRVSSDQVVAGNSGEYIFGPSTFNDLPQHGGAPASSQPRRSAQSAADDSKGLQDALTYWRTVFRRSMGV